jgi:hypothetical protein
MRRCNSRRFSKAAAPSSISGASDGIAHGVSSSFAEGAGDADVAGPVPRSFAEDPLPSPPLGVLLLAFELLVLFERVLGGLTEGIRPLLRRNRLGSCGAQVGQIREQAVRESQNAGSNAATECDAGIILGINVSLVAVPIRFWRARLEAGGLVPPGQFATGLMETGLDLLAGELAFRDLKEEWRIVEPGILTPAKLCPDFLLVVQKFAAPNIAGCPQFLTGSVAPRIKNRFLVGDKAGLGGCQGIRVRATSAHFIKISPATAKFLAHFPVNRISQRRKFRFSLGEKLHALRALIFLQNFPLGIFPFSGISGELSLNIFSVRENSRSSA